MSNEPGLTLGRLVAAERNAITALEAAKQARAESTDLRSRLERLELEIIQFQQRMGMMSAQLATAKGTGATTR